MRFILTPYGVRRRLKHTSAERGMLGSRSEPNDHPVLSPSRNRPQGRPPRPALRQGTTVVPGPSQRRGPKLDTMSGILCQGSQELDPLDDPGANAPLILLLIQERSFGTPIAFQLTTRRSPLDIPSFYDQMRNVNLVHPVT